MQKPTKKLITISAIIVALIVLVVLIVVLIPKEYSDVEIINKPNGLSEVPKGYLNAFRTTLIRHLREQNLIGKNDSIKDVSIREGTVYTYPVFNNDNAIASSFIVDIDSLQQTYQVKVIESNGDYDGIVAQLRCPRVEDMKYPDTECIAQFGDTSKRAIHHLPYETKLSSGEKLVIKNVDNNGALQVYLYSCDNKNPAKESAEKIVKSWVESLGDDSTYEVNIRTGYCEGDTI